MDWSGSGVPEAQDRAISFLLASPEHMAALLRLADPKLAARLDAGSLKQQESTLIPEDLRKVVEDVLYEGSIDGDRDLSVLVLVAHQSSADPLLAHRIHGAISRLNEAEQRRQEEQKVVRSEQRLRHVIPLVIHTGRRPWSMPRLDELYRPIPELTRFVPRFDIELLDLAAIQEEALLAENSALGCFLNLFRAQYDEAGAFSKSLTRSLEGLKILAPDAENLNAWLRFAIYFSFQRRSREEWDTMTEVAKTVLGERGQDMGETIAEYLRREGLEKGLEQGLEKGLEKGRLEGSRAMLATLLAARFPDRSGDEIRQRLQEITDAAVLEALGRRLVAGAPAWDELWA